MTKVFWGDEAAVEDHDASLAGLSPSLVPRSALLHSDGIVEHLMTLNGRRSVIVSKLSRRLELLFFSFIFFTPELQLKLKAKAAESERDTICRVSGNLSRR